MVVRVAGWGVGWAAGGWGAGEVGATAVVGREEGRAGLHQTRQDQVVKLWL